MSELRLTKGRARWMCACLMVSSASSSCITWWGPCHYIVTPSVGRSAYAMYDTYICRRASQPECMHAGKYLHV